MPFCASLCVVHNLLKAGQPHAMPDEIQITSVLSINLPNKPNYNIIFPLKINIIRISSMENFLDNVYIVMVETKTPGNIGSSVRAMKNMGISHLRLVNPVSYKDDDQQRKFGYRSQDIIENAEEFDTLADALADISTVFVTTSKKGKWKKDFMSSTEAGAKVIERMQKEKVAIVFGREESGVTIEESQLANYLVYIPSAVSYPSLNLSQAVMVMVYEIYRQLEGANRVGDLPTLATKENSERLRENIWTLMKSLNFRENEKGLFSRSLRRSLSRTLWTDADVAVFDRLCKQVRWFFKDATGKDLTIEKESNDETKSL